MTVTIKWVDGTMHSGSTPEAVMAKVIDCQWTPYTVDQMRAVLSDRAWVWSRTAVDPGLPLREFFEELERADMLSIVEWNPDAEQEGR
jgi:hypothetical protein